MLKVWGRKTSINVQKVMWLIGELELEHERFDAGGPFGGLDSATYRLLNPNKLVPAIDDDGTVLWESNVIVRYLARKYGEERVPRGNKADFALADQWMDWSLSMIYQDLVITCFYQLIRTPAADRDQAAVEAAATRLGKRIRLLERHLGDRRFIVGDGLTIADISVGSLMYRYFNLPIARPTLPSVETWYRQLIEREAYRRHVMVDMEAMKVPGA